MSLFIREVRTPDSRINKPFLFEELDIEKQHLKEKLLILSSEAEKDDVYKITNYMANWNDTEMSDKLFTIDSLIKVIVISENDIKIEWKI